MDRAVGTMGGSVPSDVCLGGNGITRRREGLAFLQGGVEGIPRPVIGTVHAAKHIHPSIDLIFAWAGQVQTVDSGTAC